MGKNSAGGLFTHSCRSFGANNVQLKFGDEIPGDSTILNFDGAKTIANGFKIQVQAKKATIIDLDADDSELPELQFESDNDCFDAKSEIGSDWSVDTYDTDYFDDRVPHDEKPPCAYVARHANQRPETQPLGYGLSWRNPLGTDPAARNPLGTVHAGTQPTTIGDPHLPAKIARQSDLARGTENLTSTTTDDHCTICCKPYWKQHYNAKHVNCRDHCVHQFTTPDPTLQSLDSNVPELPRGTTPLPTNLLSAKMFVDPGAGGLRSDAQPGHREKEHAAGNLDNHLITW